MKRIVTLCITCVFASMPASADVNPELFTLDNGMKFILLPRAEEPNSIAAGWVAKVGSVNERPGITGISHFFEHLMFKGTDTIGTTDAVVDSQFTETERSIRNAMLYIIWNDQYDRYRKGEINDPWDEANDTPQLASLRRELKETMVSHRDVIVKNEIDFLYKGEGAVGLNAFTSEDVTFYINQLPANKLELWCWIESDRLANSVFREFFSERDVVHEERRMRIESTPTGEFQEQFNSMFWQASPYSWPVIGWPSDLNSYTLEEARRYFDMYYQPSNLVGVIVGDFEVASTIELIKTYFGQLEPGQVPPLPVPTIEPSQLAPQRMVADVEAQSEVEVRYHAVPFGHKDMYPLEIMAAVLNGKTGRLYKVMVEGSEIAAGAHVGVDPKKYAGAFSFNATVKGDATPEALESAWYEQVALLQSVPVSEYELEKVKNNVVADQYRQLQSNFYLMIQLGYMEALGGWEFINNARDHLLAITSEDIMRVASEYLVANNSSVVIFNRSGDAPAIDEELAGFDPQQQAMISQALRDLELVPEDELVQSLEQMRAQASQLPPEYKPMFDYLLKKLEERVNSIPAQEEAEVLVEEEAVPVEPISEVTPEEAPNFVGAPAKLELTAQQEAQAFAFLSGMEGRTLEDLVQIYAGLQIAVTGVPAEERPVLEYILAKLTTQIAELKED